MFQFIVLFLLTLNLLGGRSDKPATLPQYPISLEKQVTGLPLTSRPYYDLVVAVFLKGDRSSEALREEEIVRAAYERYADGEIVMPGSESVFTLKVVFVVGRARLSEDTVVPDSGILDGDTFYLEIEEGYTHLGEKTKGLMAIMEHLSFRFLGKTDSDTFPCLTRVMEHLSMIPFEDQPMVYAGHKAVLRRIYPPGHKWYDPEFKKNSGGNLEHYPLYNQGAFYVLGEHLVAHLNRSRDLLVAMNVEDAMVGTWLLGFKKVVVQLDGVADSCHCETNGVRPFYHKCKNEHQIYTCMRLLGAC